MEIFGKELDTLKERQIERSQEEGEKEDPELTSSHGHIKATTTYSVTYCKNDLKTSRTTLLQLTI